MQTFDKLIKKIPSQQKHHVTDISFSLGVLRCNLCDQSVNHNEKACDRIQKHLISYVIGKCTFLVVWQRSQNKRNEVLVASALCQRSPTQERSTSAEWVLPNFLMWNTKANTSQRSGLARERRCFPSTCDTKSYRWQGNKYCFVKTELDMRSSGFQAKR